jgi:hypothetical protein
MGIVATRAPGKFIIVSGDKDMLSVPGCCTGGLYARDHRGSG